MKSSRFLSRGPMSCLFRHRLRHYSLAVAISALCVNIGSASAEVSTNFDALDHVAPVKPAPRQQSVKRTPAYSSDLQKPGATATSPNGRSGGAAGSNGAPAMPPSHREAERRVGPPPDVPPAPPKSVVIAPPPVAVETHPPVAPAPVIIDPKVQGRVRKTAHGMVLVYQAGSANLNENMLTALREYATSLAKDPGLRITIRSYASGQADDPSVPRRISLARALIVRSVLIKAGVATTRIYPRAEGLPKGDIAPPDKLEIIAVGAAPAPPGEAYYPREPQKTTP